MSDKYNEQTIKSEKIYNGKIIQLRVDTVKLPNGKEAKRELISHPGAVAILAITKENRILLVKQFRKPLERINIEIPAGKLELNENPIDCAIRELKEETGYTANNISQLVKFYTSPGFADEVVYLFKADDLNKGMATPDEDEFVDLFEVSLDEAIAMVESGEIVDAKTIVAINYLQIDKLKEKV